MTDVVMAALTGRLNRIVTLGELACLMAYRGLDSNDGQVTSQARTIIERAKLNDSLATHMRTRQVRVAGFRVFVPYSDDPYSPRDYVASINREPGQTGRWMVQTGEAPQRSEPVYDTQIEECTTACDVGAWLEKFGEELGEFAKSRALQRWLDAHGVTARDEGQQALSIEGGPLLVSHKDLCTYGTFFVRSTRKGRDAKNTIAALRRDYDLKNANGGGQLYDIEAVKEAAARHSPPLEFKYQPPDEGARDDSR